MYAIDRVEKNIVIAENLKTKEKLKIKIEDFSFEPKEGTIFSIEKNNNSNSIIVKQEEYEKKRRDLLRQKMERLKKHE